MFREVTNESDILNVPLDVNSINIKALYNGYGFSYPRFYKSDDNSTLMSLFKGHCIVYGKNNMLADFLPMVASSIVSLYPIKLPKQYSKTVGNIFCLNVKNSVKCDDISYDLSSAYEILSQVFYSNQSKDDYMEWYVNRSYMIRHNVSKVFSIKNICTCLVFCNIEDTLLIKELATTKEYRKMGYAKKLLSNICYETKAKKILLLSQDKESDNFYLKMGFENIGKYYMYDLN
ncbi:MAG: GNAT family N-acetyltransferase [Oscillospiraceae bacterium]